MAAGSRHRVEEAKMAESGKARSEHEETVGWDREGRPQVPERPVIPYIEGDGIGPDVWQATRPVLDEAVQAAYGGKRKIAWRRLLAGESARQTLGPEHSLPEATLQEIARCGVALKGPLTTPVGAGFRSVNVALRQQLDLYACIRPVRHYAGVPAPVRHPELLDVVIFRENTEDVYAGIEWPAGSAGAREVIALVNGLLAAPGRRTLSPESAVGLKPMSEFNTRRLVRKAIRYALEHKRRSVTLVHKGNIMKYTEGAFRDWGYRVAGEEFGELTVTETEFEAKFGKQPPEGRVLIRDRIADAMFQQLLLRPQDYDVIATPNLNGDYLSDAAAAQVGGLGMAPGANIGDRCAVFEATHGTAPKYAGLDRVNPGSLILSGVEMLRFLGWCEAADLIVGALEETIAAGTVTYDLARQTPGAREVKCSEFGAAVAARIRRLGGVRSGSGRKKELQG